MFWLFVSSITMSRPFIGKENFESLTKIEGVLQYSDNKVFYMIVSPQLEEKHFYILMRLLDTADNLYKPLNLRFQFVSC